MPMTKDDGTVLLALVRGDDRLEESPSRQQERPAPRNHRDRRQRRDQAEHRRDGVEDFVGPGRQHVLFEDELERVGEFRPRVGADGEVEGPWRSNRTGDVHVVGFRKKGV